MSEKEQEITQTLGKAIDEIIIALKPLDQNSRITAIRASCEHLDIPLIEKGADTSVGGEHTSQGIAVGTRITDIKELKEQKNPTSASEMAAIVAFYLSELIQEKDKKIEVDKADMEKYFKQANFPLRKFEFLLPNAKNAGYFDSMGKGKYKLNPVGYNLVAHNMPRAKSGKIRKSVKKAKQATKKIKGKTK